jgi:predicted hexulose-6-phosphate isomerase
VIPGEQAGEHGSSPRPFGIYEKALPPGSWTEILLAARTAGFDFVEMSVDESDWRLERLTWSPGERRDVARAIAKAGIPIYSICLSGHRRFGLGSADPDTRRVAMTMFDDAIGLAADLNVRVIQVAGYHAYYEAPDAQTFRRYVDGIRWGASLAARRGVMLGVENIDTPDTASAADVLKLIIEVSAVWFQAYPDVGNFAVHGLDIPSSVAAVIPHAIGLHLKDARPAEPRRVPFGQGCVPFAEVFAALAAARYPGPLTLEMWNDDPATAVTTAARALTWVKRAITRSAPALLEAGEAG